MLKKNVPTVLILLLILQSCSQAPLSDRRRLILLTDKYVMSESAKEYEKYLQWSALSDNEAEAGRLDSIGANIAAAAVHFMQKNGMEEDTERFDWKFSLMKDERANAFCMPGGQIIVLEGILPYTDSDDALALVIGHEVAHAVSKHGSERMTHQLIYGAGATVLRIVTSYMPGLAQILLGTVYDAGATLGILLPYSRVQEYEADYLGLILMSMAGYDASVAVPFWQKMSEEQEKEYGRIPEFMSTHPADAPRIDEIKRRAPEAKRKAAMMK